MIGEIIEEIYVSLPLNQILQGNTLDVLKTLPSESIDCVITSPPYWNLRDYGIDGQLGLEPTFQEYIQKLCDIFDEIKRVLKKTGTCWVNLGDTYSGSSNGKGDKTTTNRNKPETYKKIYKGQHAGKTDIPNKSLCQIPSRFAIEMCNRGWILRNELIWWKPNCMPSSAKDRFTVDFEKVFFFTKYKKYWFEQQYEPHIGEWGIRNRENFRNGTKDPKLKHHGLTESNSNPLGRNKRCIWRITTHGFPEAHFATFPEKLIEPMIKAGCPEFICKNCGKPKEKILKMVSTGRIDKLTGRKKYFGGTTANRQREIPHNPQFQTIGYTNCGCNASFGGGVVLDPFMGSGTTALVALKLNRQFIGIELKPEYIEMAYRRIKPYLEQKKLM